MPEEQIYDIAVVGCGPAGLSAALNGQIRRKKVIILGSEFCSPKLHSSPKVDNYLGFGDITGEELRQKFLKHIESVGLSINRARVTGIYPGESGFTLQSQDVSYRARTVVLATGVSTVKPIDNEIELLGRGVSYCATCDGPLFEGKRVAVLAYNQEALDEANFLSEIAAEVTVIPLLKEENETNEVIQNPKIKVIEDVPKAITGENWATGVALEKQQLEVDGIFVIRDAILPDQLVSGLEVAPDGIKVNRDLATNIEGIFAAGDCTGQPYQLSKAVGEGQVAALNAVKYVDTKHGAS